MELSRCTGSSFIRVHFVGCRDLGLKQILEEDKKINQDSNRAQASAVQHVESGACPKCRGRVVARNGVYNFIAANQVVSDL